MQQLCRSTADRLARAAVFAPETRVNFDALAECGQQGLPAGAVVKTSCRSVVSLQLGRFQARETVRAQEGNGRGLQRSGELSALVPRSGAYAFDVIAHVGLESLLAGRRLQDLQKELCERLPAVRVPLSTLYDLQQKFLFLLGHLHRHASGCLAERLGGQGGATWLLDGTLEADSPVFLGIRESASGLMLAGWKISSESAEQIGTCLAQAAEDYGLPQRVLHDLSPAMIGGCEAGLPGVPHFVCHYHLASDVGEDLYEPWQNALNKRLRELKVQLRMREQRKGQAEWFRSRPGVQARQMLGDLLAGRPLQASFSDALGREVLLAFHYWILDYRSDGRRRGYPFDPYTLYLHRRLAQAGQALERLLAVAETAAQSPPALHNLHRIVTDYLHDTRVRTAGDGYERVFAVFGRLREALRLSARQMDNLREVQELSAKEQQECKSDLETLRSDLRAQSEDPGDPDARSAAIVVGHLDKYWAHLVVEEPMAPGGRWERTNNSLESEWSALKRRRRRTHGRGKLSRDFEALPEEYLLLGNLNNPVYVDCVLGGSLDNLPGKFAAISRQAGSFSAWRKLRHRQPVGKPPRRLLRQEALPDQLVEACHRHCQAASP